MSQIKIDSLIYEVYGDVAEADVYFAGAIHADNWRSASDDTKQRALITAARMFDRTCWLGDPSETSGQPLAWPRTGTGVDGVTDDVIPEDIINGNFELALSLVDGSSVQTNATPGAQQLEIIKAGSVMLQYFRGAESLSAQQSRFTLPVMEYVSRYLCGSNLSFLGGSASGVDSDQQSVTGDNYSYNDGI
jgi:hypothetical protein